MSSDEESDFCSTTMVSQLTSLVEAVDVAVAELRAIESSIDCIESTPLTVYTKPRRLLKPIEGMPTTVSLKDLVHHFMPSWTLSVAGRRVTVPASHSTLVGLPNRDVHVYTILVALDALLEK